MNKVPEALAILDRWERKLPAGVTLEEIRILRQAVTRSTGATHDLVGRRKPNLPPTASFGAKVISLNPRLTSELDSCQRTSLEVGSQGEPRLVPNVDGYQITRLVRGASATLAGLRIRQTVEEHGLAGTKWEMQWDGRAWIGVRKITD